MICSDGISGARLDAIADNDAVVAGNKWYRHLNATYGFAAGHPAFQAAIKQFQGRRAADLSAAEPTIIAESRGQQPVSGAGAGLR